MGNVLLKIPYKFKRSYGGTPEPQTPQDAPWLHGPSLKKSYEGTPLLIVRYLYLFWCRSLDYLPRYGC